MKLDTDIMDPMYSINPSDPPSPFASESEEDIDCKVQEESIHSDHIDDERDQNNDKAEMEEEEEGSEGQCDEISRRDSHFQCTRCSKSFGSRQESDLHHQTKHSRNMIIDVSDDESADIEILSTSTPSKIAEKPSGFPVGATKFVLFRFIENVEFL